MNSYLRKFLKEQKRKKAEASLLMLMGLTSYLGNYLDNRMNR